MFEHASSAKLLEIIVEALAAQFSDALVTAMCKRLARHDEDAIKELTAKLPLQYASIIEQKLQPFVSVVAASKSKLLTFGIAPGLGENFRRLGPKTGTKISGLQDLFQSKQLEWCIGDLRRFSGI